MKQKIVLFFLAILLGCISFVNAQSADNVSIPYKKFVLKNGLTLLVHEDHKAPIVALNIWYHVGSKNEKRGRTGFAHLFEHLMFNGSENNNDDYFKAMERIGATDLNGTTNNDRTNYFENVPTSAVDVALWMESDRMGHLIGALTQPKLDEQRGVVQNEKRQGDNEPYSISEELIAQNTYPVGHPYSWTVIGAMEDLAAASLTDVHEWFKTYYGTANAVLVVAGDIDAKTAYEKVEKYFGDIPSGPPIAKHQTWVAKMTGSRRQVAQDRVPQAKLYKVWNIPEWGNKELTYLDLVSDVLSTGKVSRLFKRLVYEDQIATAVNAYVDVKEIGSQFIIEATAKPGEDLAKIERIVDEELAKFLKDGPTANELKRIKTQSLAGFVRGIERIGGFGGKSDILAQSMVYGADPEAYKTRMKDIENATAADLTKAAKDWLTDGVYILEIHPFPKYDVVKSDADRSKLPEASTPPDAKFPKVEKATLSNGLKIVLATRTSVPLVNFNMLFDAGFAADQFSAPGTSSLAMNMLDEGTKSRNSLQISEELSMLGANLGSGAGLDMSTVSLSSLKTNLDKALDLYADVILNPSFPEKEIDRLKNERFASIKREKATPIQMALRVFPQFLYGKEHAYGYPMTGSGYEETVKKISRDDLVKYYKTWIRPNNGTLIIVGDITMSEIKPKLEKLFKDWKQGETPKKNLSEVKFRDRPIVYIMDKPGSPQSVILAGHVAPPRSDPDNIAIESMNNILGGTFTSRINMNLREDKHWSYGASSFIMGAKGQRPFITYAFIQGDKTKESIQEIRKEITGMMTDKPATEDELSKIKKNQILELPGSWETNGAVGGTLSEMVIYNLPDNYIDTYISKVKNLSLSDIHKNAKRVLHPDNIVWVVVGDKAKIEGGLKDLGYDIKSIDGDGNMVE